MKNKLAIFIPACNEERAIGSVVQLAKKYGTVYVVDDGSTDKTAEIARRSGAKVITHPRNMGYGVAVRTAFGAAEKIDADAFVFLDGDMQHDPGEIPRVAAPVLAGRADVCVGSRFLGSVLHAPPARKEGVRVMNSLSGVRAGKEFDYECGFRAFSKKAARSIRFMENGYAACSEMVVAAVDAGLSVEQVPVTVRYFEGGGKSAIAQGTGLLAYLLPAAAKRKPLLFFGGAGVLFMAASGLLGIFVVQTFYSKGVLPTGSAFLTVFTGIVGLVLVLIGINLYTLEAVLTRRGMEPEGGAGWAGRPPARLVLGKRGRK